MKRFGRFWWDFVVGDDWLAAAGVALAIGATAALAAAGQAAWWLLPPATVLVLYGSLRRATDTASATIEEPANVARIVPPAAPGSRDHA